MLGDWNPAELQEARLGEICELRMEFLSGTFYVSLLNVQMVLNSLLSTG